jgi:hypothetical protein
MPPAAAAAVAAEAGATWHVPEKVMVEITKDAEHEQRRSKARVMIRDGCRGLKQVLLQGCVLTVTVAVAVDAVHQAKHRLH